MCYIWRSEYVGAKKGLVGQIQKTCFKMSRVENTYKWLRLFTVLFTAALCGAHGTRPCVTELALSAGNVTDPSAAVTCQLQKLNVPLCPPTLQSVGLPVLLSSWAFEFRTVIAIFLAQKKYPQVLFTEHRMALDCSFWCRLDPVL